MDVLASKSSTNEEFLFAKELAKISGGILILETPKWILEILISVHHGLECH